VIELKNIILRRVSIFEFSHSQGQIQTFVATEREIRFAPISGHHQLGAARPISAISGL
jgi:hypothetical protein